ncbi:MAG: YgjV family protein [Pseudomonadota bacterium]
MGAGFIYPEMFVVAAFAATFGGYFMPSRQTMMRIRFVGCACSALYFLSVGADTGAIASSIACIGTFIQSIVPERYLKKTLMLRTGIAVFLASCAIIVFWGSQSIFSLLGSITARLSEVQSCTQRIRLGFMVGHGFWLIYMVQEGLLPYFIFESIMLLASAATFLHAEHKKRRALVMTAL